MESVIDRFLGSGSGSGSGYGSGSGDGDGSGSGYGDGYGSGYGYGYGLKTFNGDTVHAVDGIATLISHVRGNVAKGSILRDDLSLEPCFVVKQDNLFAHGATLREAQAALTEKIIETMDPDEKIALFIEEFKPDVKYPARSFYDWHHRLTGSCEQGRSAFARDHGINVGADMLTVDEFIQLTENAYGGEIIRRLKAALER